MPTLKDHDFSLPRSRVVEENCRREGQFGRIYDLNGNFYTGDWLRNKRHGIGKNSYTRGDAYLGQWQKGKRHGYGLLKKLDQVSGEQKLVYEGQWKNGEPSGNGVSFLKDGSYYEGEFKQGKRYGHGTMVYSSDDSHYTGDWVDNVPHGYGMLTDASGTFYEGEFQDGLCHGTGIFVLPDRRLLLRGVWEHGRWFTGESMTIPNDSELLEFFNEIHLTLFIKM